jgi:hypothetical protein
MAENRFHNSSDSNLDLFVHGLLDVVLQDPARFGLDPDLAHELEASAHSFTESLGSLAAARAAYAAAAESKRARRRVLLSVLSRAAKRILEEPGLSDADILETGLRPPEETRSRVRPHKPQNLYARPSVDGEVELNWSRGDNAYGVTYLIEAQRADEPWRLVLATTKTRIKLRGFAPGIKTAFRVTATHNETFSIPCATVFIYPNNPALAAA